MPHPSHENISHQENSLYLIPSSEETQKHQKGSFTLCTSSRTQKSPDPGPAFHPLRKLPPFLSQLRASLCFQVAMRRTQASLWDVRTQQEPIRAALWGERRGGLPGGGMAVRGLSGPRPAPISAHGRTGPAPEGAVRAFDWDRRPQAHIPGLACVRLQGVCVCVFPGVSVCVYVSRRTIEPSQNMREVNFSREPWSVWWRQAPT